MDAIPDPYRFEDQLMSLIANDSAREVILKLKAGPLTAKELAAATDLSVRSVNRILEQAELIGFASPAGAFRKVVNDPLVYDLIDHVASLSHGESSWEAIGEPRAIRTLRLLLGGACHRSELNLLGPSARISDVLKLLKAAGLVKQDKRMWDLQPGSHQQIETLVDFPAVMTQTALSGVLRAAHQDADVPYDETVRGPSTSTTPPDPTPWLPSLAGFYNTAPDPPRTGELYLPSRENLYAEDRHASGPIIRRLHAVISARNLGAGMLPTIGMSYAQRRALHRAQVINRYGVHAPATALQFPKIAFKLGVEAAAVFSSQPNVLTVDFGSQQLQDAILAVTSELDLHTTQRIRVGEHLAMRHAVRIVEYVIVNELYSLEFPAGADPAATPDRLDYCAAWTHDSVRSARRVVQQYLATHTPAR